MQPVALTLGFGGLRLRREVPSAHWITLMDADARRRLLSEKLIANGQRRRREELLSRLPRQLSEVLGVCPCVYASEGDTILRRVFPFNASGVAPSAFRPAHYGYTEVAWEYRMLALLPRLEVPERTGQAFLLLQRPAPGRLNGEDCYFAALPFFVVDFQWAAGRLEELWRNCTWGMLLVEEDMKAGILIARFSGILPEDPNPHEIGYEVGMWPVRHEGGPVDDLPSEPG